MRKRARSRVVRAVLAALILLGGTEAVLRARRGPPPDAESLFSDEARYLYAESREPFFRRDGAVWTAARPRALPQSFPDAKPANELRVIVVGESVARRLGVEAVREAFQDAFPNKKARAINAGMGTYASGQWGGVLAEALDHAPDVVVLMAGNNEGLRPDRIWYPAYRLNLALRRSWLWRLAQDALARRRPDRAAIEARFEGRLRAAVRAAHERGAAVVLCTLPVNARDYPPEGALPRGDADFDAGWAARERGDARAAAEAFARFSARRPESAMGHYWLARALDASGETASARAHFAAAIDRDDPDRCPASRNEAIRRISREENAALADLEKLFARRAPDGVPGWESFDDGVHPRPALLPLVARALADAAAARSDAALDAFPPAPAWRAGPELDEVSWTAAAEALQAGLREPPLIYERAVAELELVARTDPKTLKRVVADPDALEKAFGAGDWTRALVPLVSRGGTSLRAHVDEARRRARLAAGTRAGKLL